MTSRSAIKTDRFAFDHHSKKIDPLADIESHIDFAALAGAVDRVTPRPISAQDGRPPYPTKAMVRILIRKEDQEQLRQDAIPATWRPAKRCHKDLDATWTKKHDKSHFGYKLSVSVDKQKKIICKIATGTASTHVS